MKKLILFLIIIFLGSPAFSAPADSAKYFKVKIKSLDSLLESMNGNSKTIQMQMNYDADKKIASVYAEMDKKEMIFMEERQKLKIIIYCLCLVSLVVMGFAFYVLKKVKQKK